MISIFVQHNFSNLKVPISPGTSLNEVLIASVKHFKLEGNYELKKDGKSVELDLPWRLLNYTANSKFHLVEGPNGGNTECFSGTKGKKVKIRFQVQGKGTLIKEIADNEPFSSVMNELANEQQWQTSMEEVSIQFFSKTIKFSDFHSTTLKSLGIESPSNIKVIVGTEDQGNKIQSSVLRKAEEDIQVEDTSVKSNNDKVVPDAMEEEQHEFYKPIIYLPPATSISQRIHDVIDNNEDDTDYELTVEHARLYQNMVAKQAGSLGGPLITKRMREQQGSKLRPNIKKIDECFIRIRFPDLTQVEAIFKTNDTIDTVYKIVAKMIKESNEKFGLYQTHPYKKLHRSNLKLVDDLGFGSKTILIFESEHNITQGPFIEEAMLAKAKNITASMERKTNGNINKEEKESKEPRKLKFDVQTQKGLPKWLKLSKK